MPQMGGGGGSRFDYIQSATPDTPQNGELWFDTDGGSDGTGEVKVYDGASGAWEVTGYTSHGDLTGVTPDAHHSPVTASDPLTEDGMQGLGLDLGKGLTLSNGSLRIATGGDIGFDTDDNIEIPNGAVNDFELAFNPVKQTEFNTHAGAAGAHHNPVSVSNPLTEDGAQGLGLDLGKGLTISGGSLVPDLSSDLSFYDGKIQIPAGVINREELNFDTATQSELNAHARDDSAHHSRYTDTEARDALRAGINYIDLTNIEFGNLPNREAILAWDDSEGLRIYWDGQWRQIHSEGPTGSDPSHDDLEGVSSSDHHTRYTDGEAADAAPVDDVAGQTGSVTWRTESFSGQENTIDTAYHSFNYTYNPDAVMINVEETFAEDDTEGYSAFLQSKETDGNGNVTGAYIDANANGSSTDVSYNLRVMGVVV